MGGTPFTNLHTLKIFNDFKYNICQKASDADVIVSHNVKNLLPCILKYPKKQFLVWTNEPRADTTFKNEIKLPFDIARIHIMNVYGKDVFWHNLHFLSSYHFDNGNDLGIDVNKPLASLTKEQYNTLNKQNKVAALYTNTGYKKSRLIKNGDNIDLTEKRCQYAVAGHNRKLLDIYGNRWPKGYALDNSGFGFERESPWWIEKIGTLNSYKFNLCFENTAYHHYVTEKIWHAILAYTLPIYQSFNSTIYESFPKDSFIDAFLFPDEHALFDYIEQMSVDEYLERVNVCIDVFNKCLQAKRDIYDLNAYTMVEKILTRLTNNPSIININPSQTLFS